MSIVLKMSSWLYFDIGNKSEFWSASWMGRFPAVKKCWIDIVYLCPKSASITWGHLQKITLGFVQKVVAAAEIFPATKSVMRFPSQLRMSQLVYSIRRCWQGFGNEASRQSSSLTRATWRSEIWRCTKLVDIILYFWQNSKICILSLGRSRTFDSYPMQVDWCARVWGETRWIVE